MDDLAATLVELIVCHLCGRGGRWYPVYGVGQKVLVTFCLSHERSNGNSVDSLEPYGSCQKASKGLPGACRTWQEPQGASLQPLAADEGSEEAP